MEEVSRKHWDYILCRDGESLILSVVCGTVGIFEVNIKLDDIEARHYAEQGEAYLVMLVQSVRNNPNVYASRQIK